MPEAFHLVGIGGVGMSALAQLLLDRGAVVSGSDRFLDEGRELPVAAVLRRAGATLLRQDGSGVRAELDAVVASTAVEKGNPDLEAAAARGVSVRHRAELLAACAAPHRVAAVAGTAGKTTVTALLGWLAAETGLDPVVVNGGEVVDWCAPDRVGSVRPGRSGRWILEADESDRSLLRFHPRDAILTNISCDHFAMEEAVEVFRRFAAQVDGVLVTTRAVAGMIGGHPGLVAIDDADRLGLETAANGSLFRLESVRYTVPLPGRHNAENAAMAVALCRAWGVAAEPLAEALRRFRGVRRRLELVGESGGVRVIDDYAHNPAKLRAAWTAVAERAPRVVGVWRPHGFAPLALMFDDLVETFAACCRPADRLFLLPVFYAGGTATSTRSSAELASALADRGVAAVEVPDYGALAETARRTLTPGDTLLVMGARDPELPLFARRMAS